MTNHQDTGAERAKCTAADGVTEVISVPGYPLMVKASDFNQLHGKLQAALASRDEAAAQPQGLSDELIGKLSRIHKALSNACRKYGEVGSRDVDIVEWNGRLYEAVYAVGSLLCEMPAEQVLAAKAQQPQWQAECNNADCGWKGPLSEACMLGEVGPLCPECRETCHVEPQVQAVSDEQIDEVLLRETGFDGFGTQEMNASDLHRICRAILALRDKPDHFPGVRKMMPQEPGRG